MNKIMLFKRTPIFLTLVLSLLVLTRVLCNIVQGNTKYEHFQASSVYAHVYRQPSRSRRTSFHGQTRYVALLAAFVEPKIATYGVGMGVRERSGFPRDNLKEHIFKRTTKKCIHLNRLRNSANFRMMPIGIPRVAYKSPGSNNIEWIDIFNRYCQYTKFRLYRERIIFVGQELTDEFVNQIIAIILYLDGEDSKKPINLYLNCPGGSVYSGLALYDTMQHVRCPVATINIGMAASMASLILAAGTPGMRFALPHSRVMIHQPMGGIQGQAEDIRVEATHILKVTKDLVKMYSTLTGQSQEKLQKDLERDYFMSAVDAKKYGLIDQVIELSKKEGI